MVSLDKYEEYANKAVRKVYWMRETYPSDKQYTLFKSLLEFMKEHDLPTCYFEKPRNRKDFSTKISAMTTVIKKSGLYEEFVQQHSDEKGES